jgi:hypothetical protein
VQARQLEEEEAQRASQAEADERARIADLQRAAEEAAAAALLAEVRCP